LNVADFRAQLEAEYTWRLDEIRFFQNQCSAIQSEGDQGKFRRAIVLLLYAHFEGFSKFALALYADAINQEGIECNAAHHAIAAASLHDLFVSLRDGTRKAKEFGNQLPDDAKLHRFARDREFLERAEVIMSRKVEIPDGLIDMESNLKPVVLRKNLYRLGLPYDQFSELDGDVDMLLELRNKISHGESKSGVTQHLYDKLFSAATRVMTGITAGVTQAFDERWFLKGA